MDEEGPSGGYVSTSANASAEPTSKSIENGERRRGVLPSIELWYLKSESWKACAKGHDGTTVHLYTLIVPVDERILQQIFSGSPFVASTTAAPALLLLSPLFSFSFAARPTDGGGGENRPASDMYIDQRTADLEVGASIDTGRTLRSGGR